MNCSDKLPRDWTWVELGEIVQPIRPRQNPQDFPKLPFIGLEHLEPHTMKLLGTVPAKTMRSSAIHFQPGDLLYGRLRPYLNKVYRPDFEGLCSAEFIVLPPSRYIDQRYLQYLLNSWDFVTFASHLNEGDRPRVDFAQIATYPVPLPPLPEQYRIVAKIEELFSRLDAGVEALRDVQYLLERYQLSVLRAAFNGSLTNEWRKITNKNRYNVIITQSPYLEELIVDDLPPGWFYIALGELGELNRGKSKHRPRNDPRLFGGKYPFIQTGDISNARDVICEYTQTYNDFGLDQSRLWPANTLCITIAANIARTAILGFPACFPDSVVGFVADEDKVNVWYVHYYMQSIQPRLEKLAPATAQKNINLEILSHVPIPYCHLDEQAVVVSEIERRLAIADMLKETITGSMAKSSMMRQSLLRRAFTGQLVPQDPTDEPASKLLERIRAERARIEAEQPRRRKRRAN